MSVYLNVTSACCRTAVAWFRLALPCVYAIVMMRRHCLVVPRHAADRTYAPSPSECSSVNARLKPPPLPSRQSTCSVLGTSGFPHSTSMVNAP